MIARGFTDYADTLRRRLLYSLPGPPLGAAWSLMVELHPEKFLHHLLTLHHSTDDENVCANQGAREVMETRVILPRRINRPDACGHRNQFCQTAH